MSDYTSFERLAMSISSQERLELLSKMQNASSPEKEQIQEKEQTFTIEDSDLNLKIKSESFLLRLWFKIKSIFASCSVDFLYNKYLLGLLAKEVEQETAGMLDSHSMSLQNQFYEELKTLNDVSQYFKMGIAIYEENPGSFFTFMGSLIFTELEGRLEESANPYIYPSDQDIPTDLRSTLLHHMDEILQSLPTDQKGHMYQCVQSLDWLKQFCRLPFEKVLSKFKPNTKGTRSCQLDSIQNELATIAKVMNSSRKVYTEVLEALFLSTYQSQHLKDSQSLDKSSADSTNLDPEKLDTECAAFVNKSLEEVSKIRSFLNTVPIIKITQLAQGSATWHCEKIEGMEDWFVKFKGQWRKAFDKKWDNWLKDREKQQTIAKIKEMFKSEEVPLIANRPWANCWGGIPFPKEYQLGFIFNFYQKIYTEYIKTLKTIMMEGEFLNRENLNEFTDSYNALNRIDQNLTNLNKELAPKGNYGTVFESASTTQARTIQNYAKITTMISSIENECETMIAQFKTAGHTIVRVLNGLLSPNKATRYDTLANINSIQGGLNEKFKAGIQSSLFGIDQSIKILDAIDKHF